MPGETQLERLRYVAGHYRDLQGLILVPFGLMHFVSSLQNGGRLWMYAGDCGWRSVWIGLAVLLAWLAKTYYERTVGRAWPAIRAGGSYRGLMMVIGIAFVLGFFAAPWFDYVVRPPISATALVIAALALTLHVAIRGKFHVHYLYLALLYVAVSLLPLTGQVTTLQLVKDPVLFGVLYGLPWVVGGLGDHIFLMRSLKPIPREAVDGSI